MYEGSEDEGLNLVQSFTKRIVDFWLSFIGLILVFPIILLAWLAATLETKSNGFFIQERIGRKGRVIRIVKIKTMKEIEGFKTSITSSGDPRITRSGTFFRKAKIDELPQLWNVLIGEMSFVGPRPDVPGYVDHLKGGDRILLSLRPGITGPASLKYSDEEEVLALQENPEKYNDEVIWPDKVKINREYIKNYSLKKDLIYIWKTIVG